MSYFAVDVSHLTDDQLAFFGWEIVAQTEKYWLFRHVRTGEEQIVDKGPKRMLVVDDLNDASQMRAESAWVIPAYEDCDDPPDEKE